MEAKDITLLLVTWGSENEEVERWRGDGAGFLIFSVKTLHVCCGLLFVIRHLKKTIYTFDAGKQRSDFVPLWTFHVPKIYKM